MRASRPLSSPATMGMRMPERPARTALEQRFFLLGDELDQPALHLEESDLDRVLLARLDQRRGAADELADALLEQGGLVERTGDGFLQALGQSRVHGRRREAWRAGRTTRGAPHGGERWSGRSLPDRAL